MFPNIDRLLPQNLDRKHTFWIVVYKAIPAFTVVTSSISLHVALAILYIFNYRRATVIKFGQKLQ